MDWIEVIGPPGAGKSTVIDELSTEQDIIETYGMAPYKYAISKENNAIYNMFHKLPDAIKKTIMDRYLQYRLGAKYFDIFLLNYPEFASAAINSIKRIERGKRSTFGRWRRAAQRHIMCMESQNDQQIVCFDEGIFQQIFTIQWYLRGEWDSTEYIRSAPTPSLIIIVDAPWEVCLDRQRDRGNITVNKSWVTNVEREQQIINNAVDSFYKKLLSFDFPVVKVDNISNITHTMDEVNKEINKYHSDND